MNHYLTPSSARERARVLADTATKAGVSLRGSHGTVMTASVQFAPGDRAAYAAAEAACLRVLALVPMLRPGTVWGTDSGSVGGAAGLREGLCRMNKSGVSSRLVTATAGLQ